MKHRTTIVIVLLLVCLIANAQELRREYCHNLNCSLSFLSSLRTSIGYEFAWKEIVGFHGVGNSLGLSYQYQFGTSVNVARAYYNRYYWDIPVLVGISIPFCINKVDIGIAPHFGVSFFGNFALYYRYNVFFGTSADNFQEIVFEANIPIVSKKE